MKYRLLTGSKEDMELVIELAPYTNERMPNEPVLSIFAWRFYFNDSYILVSGQNPKDRSLDRAWRMLHPKALPEGEEWEEWKMWAKKFRWMERSMVYDFLADSIKHVGDNNARSTT